MVGRFRVGRQGIPRPRGLVCKASGLLVGLWAPRQRGLVSRVPCAASLPVTLECPAPHPLPGPPGPLRVVRFDIVFVLSFDIFDQRQGFGSRAVFVMLCDGNVIVAPRCGRAGETREGGAQEGR